MSLVSFTWNLRSPAPGTFVALWRFLLQDTGGVAAAEGSETGRVQVLIMAPGGAVQTSASCLRKTLHSLHLAFGGRSILCKRLTSAISQYAQHHAGRIQKGVLNNIHVPASNPRQGPSLRFVPFFRVVLFVSASWPLVVVRSDCGNHVLHHAGALASASSSQLTIRLKGTGCFAHSSSRLFRGIRFLK